MTGRMADKWKMVRLGDVCDIAAGQGAPQGDENYCKIGGTPFIKAGNLECLVNGVSLKSIQAVGDEIAHSHKLRLYPKGTIVFAKSGMSCVKEYVYELEDDCYVVNHLACILPNKMDATYIKYYFRATPPSRLIKDFGYPSIRLTDIANIILSVPDVKTQKRIAEVLDKASELIKKRKEQIRLMDELAKSLFIEMFGDPVENPMGWDVKLLDELGKFKNGINFGQKDTGYVVKFLGVGDFKSQNVFDNIDSLSSVKLTEKPNPEYFLNDGDIVFVRSNGSKELVGRNIIIYPRGKLVTFSGFCIRFRVLSNHILPEYLQNLLLIPSLKSRLLENGRGCNIQNLNQQMLSSINIPLPPLELQKAFVNRIDAIEQQKALLQNGLAKMETAYKALMQEYFG